MTNAYLNFGEVSTAANAAAYAANVIKLDTPRYFAGANAKAVFVATSAVSGFKAALYSDDTTTPTAIVAQAPTAVTLAAGDIVELAIPATLGTYLRAGGTASAAGGRLEICIELGEPRP